MEKTGTHIVIDMLYDFIDGSLACVNSGEAVKKSVEYINAHPGQQVLYVCDCHPADHCSFEENGGIWPVHCVVDTKGGSIHEDYYKKIEKPENRPSENNIFYKGRNKDTEEYSGYGAVNGAGEKISSVCSTNVIISGIATEYCIKETVLNLYRHGFNVTIIKDALAFVTLKGHIRTMEELGKIATVK